MESILQVRPRPSKLRNRAYLEQEQLYAMCVSIQQMIVQNDIELEQERKRQKTEKGYIAVY